MTKEELEKEAEEKYGEVDREFIACQDEGEVFNIGYVLGAEPREKRIAELEHQLTHRNCVDCSNHSSKLRMRNLELEKENAELKEKLKPENCLKLLAKEGYIKFTSDQLTKAKEIITELYHSIPSSMADYCKDAMGKAENFLKDSEVEK
jgi:hypothetical protein